MTAGGRRQTYSDGGGWSIMVPPGWHVLPFREVHDGITAAGAQLSNIPLPPPSVIPGAPPQVRILPAYGISLAIAAGADPGLSSFAVTDRKSVV